MNATLNRWIARLLMVSLVNPVMFIAPVMARDTDIYAGFQATSTEAVKPNILLLLDTSDSMNSPEGWREYAGDYDSHVEYLWANTGLITSSEQYDEHASKIALGIRPLASITATGTVATVTTSSTHAFAAGWSVTISNALPSAYNGTFVITSVPSTATFTYNLPTAPGVWASVPGITANGAAVSSITRSTKTATVTKTAHGLTIKHVIETHLLTALTIVLDDLSFQVAE